MCGIVGYVGDQKAVPILIAGLTQLEYRGYDSSGVAVIEKNATQVTAVKEKGKIKDLTAQLRKSGYDSTIGIGHTRWATHGEPSRINAHPHCDTEKRFAVVHNGIFENYQEVRNQLMSEGYVFTSQTDTECAVHLIAKYYDGDLRSAVEKAASMLRGAFVILAIAVDDPDTIVAFRRSNPLVIGLSDDAHFIASDVSAILAYTKKVIYVEDDHTAVVHKDRVAIYKINGKKAIVPSITTVEWDIEKAQKCGYPHFMLKEIHEQPEVIRDILHKHIHKEKGVVRFDSIDQRMMRRLQMVSKIFVVSCGTAYHAGLAAKYVIEEHLKVPVEVNVSSEFRYSDPILFRDDLVILVSQSGETADTLAAMHEAKAKGALTLAICNVMGSTIARESDMVVYTHAGPEIGVASTKAYLAQLTMLCLLTTYLGRIRRVMKPEVEQAIIAAMKKLPKQVEAVIADHKKVYACARKLAQSKNFIYLGRGHNYATALEGALKLKEISYIHAHGYAAGEMKHGPIALVDKYLPIVCIAPQTKTYEKMLSNIQEVKAREGIVIAIATEGDRHIEAHADDVLFIPDTLEMLSPILSIIPLQFLAYKVAVLNECDVDQPKNLAKSVTVE